MGHVNSSSFSSRNTELNFCLTGSTSNHLLQLRARKTTDVWRILTVRYSGNHSTPFQSRPCCNHIAFSPASYMNSCSMMFIYLSHLFYLRISHFLTPMRVYAYTSDLLITVAISTSKSGISRMCWKASLVCSHKVV